MEKVRAQLPMVIDINRLLESGKDMCVMYAFYCKTFTVKGKEIVLFLNLSM